MSEPRSEARSKSLVILGWSARILAAAILVQTLFFKFTAAPESVAIFEKLGMEPVGRIGSGIGELIAASLLLMPVRRFAALGAAMTLGVIGAAIFFHLTTLGIVVADDGGLLFGMAVVVFVAAAVTLALQYRGLLEWLPGSNRPDSDGSVTDRAASQVASKSRRN